MIRGGQGQVAGWGQLMSRLAPSFAGMFGGGGGLQDLLGGPQQQQDPFGRAGVRSGPHHTSPGFGTGGQFGIPNADDWNRGAGPAAWGGWGDSNGIPGVKDLPDPGTGIGEVQRMGLPGGHSIDPRWASVIAAGLGPLIGSFGDSELDLAREKFEREKERSQSPWAGRYASAMMGLEPDNYAQSGQPALQPTLQQDLQDLSGEDRERSELRNRFRYGRQFRVDPFQSRA